MKNRLLVSGLVAALIACAACSSPSTSNSSNRTTTTTTTNTTTNTTRPTTTTNTSNTTTSNSGQSNSANTGGAASTSGNTQGKQDFTLHNATGVTIHRLYVSPHDENEWGEDILGRDALANGESIDITFSPKEQAKMWDLRVEDSQGNSIEWENLNLLEISDVTLHYQNGKGTADLR